MTFTLSNLATVGSFAVRCAALALPSAADAQQPEFEKVVVTVSRIARPDLDSACPVVSIGQVAYERTATSTLDTALSRMPQFVAPDTNTSDNLGNWGRANLELRRLSCDSTLVPLNGRRVVPADST